MRSVLKYIGMKNITFNINEYNIYCEPFGGSFNCGFKLIENGFKGKLICNDLDKQVVNFWECLRDNPDKLYKEIIELHAQLKDNNLSKKLTIEKRIRSNDRYKQAAVKYCYSKEITPENSSKLVKISDMLLYDLEIFSDILNSEQLQLKNTDYSEIFNTYDSDETFMFIDPPYRGKEYYIENTINHQELHDKIVNLKCNWLLTYNDNEYIRDLYDDYNIDTKTRSLYGIQYKEIYISKSKESVKWEE